MSENTGKPHENKMVIINYGEYDEYLRNAWFRGFREGYDMAMKFGLGCQQCYETGEKIACARAEECRKKIKEGANKSLIWDHVCPLEPRNRVQHESSTYLRRQ